MTGITKGDIFALAAVALAAAYWGATLSWLWFHKQMRAALAEHQGFMVSDVTVNVENTVEEKQIRYTYAVKVSAPEIETHMVEVWLEKRGLVAMPKGKDLSVPRREQA